MSGEYGRNPDLSSPAPTKLARSKFEINGSRCDTDKDTHATTRQLEETKLVSARISSSGALLSSLYEGDLAPPLTTHNIYLRVRGHRCCLLKLAYLKTDWEVEAQFIQSSPGEEENITRQKKGSHHE